MILAKIDALCAEIEELNAEIALYSAMRDDYILSRMPVVGIKTDFVYEEFCRRHPEITVSQRKFSGILCKEFNLKSVQGWLDGMRGSFYERNNS